MKLFDKALRKTINELKADLRVKQRHIDQLISTIAVNDKEARRIQLDHDAEIAKVRKFFEDEIEAVRIREANKWKVIVNEKEDELIRDRKFIADNKSTYDYLKEREADLEETISSMRIKVQSAGNLTKEVIQTLLSGTERWESYSTRHLKNDSKVLANLENI